MSEMNTQEPFEVFNIKNDFEKCRKANVSDL